MEKRKIKRIKKRIMVKINNRPAILIDISKGGIKLSSAIVPSKPEVNIEIRDNNQVFNLKGRIRWITRRNLARIDQWARADEKYRLALIRAQKRACDDVRSMSRDLNRVLTFENRLVKYFREEAGLEGRGIP